MKWIKKIPLWWRFEGRYYHKDFYRGVTNLIKWFPVIWKDRDWDHTYIYELIKVKLNNQADYIGGRDRHTRAKRDAELMRLCARLIQRCQDDFYHMEYMDYHETKYDFVPTDETAKWYTMEDTLISERFDEYFAKYPKQYQQILAQEMMSDTPMLDPDQKKHIAMAIAHANQDRCRKLLFKVMEARIDGWWD
jgi:hypothetical protein